VDELGNVFGRLTSGRDKSPSGGCLQKLAKKSPVGAKSSATGDAK
jgi:hypothetical protein